MDNMLRYSCQLKLPDFDQNKQDKLKNARVLVVGAGGLGCPALQYLAAMGIGTLGIVDFDVVSASNLHRQILYTPAEVGQHKAKVAQQKLQAQNPDIQIVAMIEKITSHNIFDILKDYDLVLDGTDNFETRYLLNDACFLTKKPLVYGAIYQYEGQVAVWNVERADGFFSPNYRDVFPEVDASQVPNCSEGGVIPTIAGIIGCMQANEVVKYFTKTGELLTGKILMLDALTLQSRIIKINPVTNINIQKITQSLDIQTIILPDFLQEKEKYHLIDVRTHEERAVFDFGGEHIPLQELDKQLPFLTKEKPILFYCASGKRSAEAVKKYLESGVGQSAFSLEGGVKEL
jgi:adenylyltransferase/sulfurtransferase